MRKGRSDKLDITYSNAYGLMEQSADEPSRLSTDQTLPHSQNTVRMCSTLVFYSGSPAFKPGLEIGYPYCDFSCITEVLIVLNPTR